MTASHARRLIAAAAAAMLLSACAHDPAFRASLPDGIDAQGKSLAIVGDLQQTPGFIRFVRRREETSADQRRLIDDLATRIDDLSALVIVGDLVYTARSRRDWDHFDRLVEPFIDRIPVLPAIGNHDYPCFLVRLCSETRMAKGMSERFPWFVPGQPYSVDSGDLILLFLDSESQHENQGRWLEERLAEAAEQYSAALVFFHRPPFTNSIDPGAKGDVEAEAHIVPVLENAALPVVVFNGHVHGFEHIVRNGVHYITTAGGGGPRGPMADERPFDVYRGRDCPQPGDRGVFRPFNYALLSERPGGISIDIHGFCRGDEEIGVLDSIEIDFQTN